MSQDESGVNPAMLGSPSREKFDMKSFDDLYTEFIKRKKDAASRRIDAEALPWIAFIDGKWKLTAHENITNSDEALGIALAAVMKATGDPVEVYKLKSNYVYTDAEEAMNFFYGIALGATDTTPTRLDRTKRKIELGRAVAFAIRVHGEFQQSKRLGLSALKKDQFFFGNNFGETDKKNSKVNFGLKILFSSNFKDTRIGEAYYEIFSKLLHRIGLTDLDDDNYKKAIELNVIAFDDYITRYMRPIASLGKGRGKSKTVLRRPNKPTRSPLFLKVESKLLQEVLSPIWENLDRFKKGWIDYIWSWGYSATADKISEIMNTRWTVLESYARVTTSRLVAVRQLRPEVATAKKSDITSKEINEILLKRQHLSDSFVGELFAIIPHRELATILGEGLLHGKTVPLTEEQSYNVLYAKAHALYMSVGFINPGVVPKEAQLPDESKVAEVFSLIREQCSRIQAAKRYYSSLQGHNKSEQTLATTAKMLIALTNNVATFLKKNDSVDKTLALAVYGLIKDSFPLTKKTSYEGILDYSQWLINAGESLANTNFELDNGLRIRILRAIGLEPW